MISLKNLDTVRICGAISLIMIMWFVASGMIAGANLADAGHLFIQDFIDASVFLLVISYFVSLVSLIIGSIYGFYRKDPGKIFKPKAFLELESKVAYDLATHDWINRFLIFIFCFMCLVLFSLSKSLIPDLNSYSWDPAFYELEKFIHFGKTPQEWFLTLGSMCDPIIRYLDEHYSKNWFLLMMFTFCFVIFVEKDKKLQARFLITYFASWFILGLIAATIFASVGPIYFAETYGAAAPEIYTQYMGYLNSLHTDEAPLRGIIIFEKLVEETSREDLSYRANGFSAMPSLHVGIGALLFLYYTKKSYILGAFFFLFAVMMMFGSFIMGWHYAIDGYVAIIGVAIIWMLAGRFVDMLPKLQEPDQPDLVITDTVSSMISGEELSMSRCSATSGSKGTKRTGINSSDV